MGAGNRIIVRIEGIPVSVRDCGRRIPLGKVIDCVSTINTGAKYNDDVFQFSVGLNGGGTKAINEFYQAFYKGEDVREGIAAAIAIRIKNPIFESQTKNKLSNANTPPWILQEVYSKVVDRMIKANLQQFFHKRSSQFQNFMSLYL